MAVLGCAFAGSLAAAGIRSRTTRSMKLPFRLGVYCIGWDPEGLLGPPQGGHIARMEFRRRLEKDAKAREEFSHLVREETERRRARRESRVPPETNEGLVEYFLDTEATDIEYEIARLRPRLTKDFIEHIKIELAKLRFAVAKTKEMEDRVIELEAMQKVLLEGTEAYDKMEGDLVLAKERLMKILQSKDRNSTLLEMVERNELSRSVLALLDENIADALKNDQDIAADGCFSLGMVAHFEPVLREKNAWMYPRLFWETGVLGQMLYLEAHAVGISGTGIGCYFDDDVHEVLGLKGLEFQSLYHFTVGSPVLDKRIMSLPAYPGPGG